MKIFLITDIHHGENSNYALGGPDYVNIYGEEFARRVPSLLPVIDTCDLVVNLGDLIRDTGPDEDRATYREAMRLLASAVPTKHVAGNHDLRNLSSAAWADLVGEARSYYSFDLGGYHHVVLDGNAAEPRGPYHIEEEQLIWLEKDLADTQLKAIVYCHFPLDNQNLDTNYYFKGRPERGSLGNKSFVRSIMQKSGKVIAAFSGHTHFFSEQAVDGILYITVPSFSENNGFHEPQAQYGIATVEGGSIRVAIERAS